jgi:hypothetical protein
MTSEPRRPVIRTAVAVFLPLAVLGTLLAGLVAVVAQQELRTGADSPQLQQAEDAARALDGGATPSAVTGPVAVDLGQSLAPFVVVFDAGGRVLATSGRLDGADPAPPIGVLEHATAGAPNPVTWQPSAGVRMATVTVRWSGGTVLAGRSLREVERRVDVMQQLVALGWAATMVALALASLAAVMLLPRSRPGARA